MTRLSVEQVLGMAMEHHRAGRAQQAESLYRQILTSLPDQPDALHLLGLVVAGNGRFGEAIGLIERAIAIHPNTAEYRYNLARVLESAKRDEQAIEAYRQASQLRPEFVESWNNLGAVLLRRERYAESIDAFSRAVSLRPDLADAQICIGVAWQRQLKLDEAIASFERALSLRQDDPLASYNLGTARLLVGDLARGWEGYEQRWKIGPRSAPPRLAGHAWDGSNIQGKRILLWPEQGFGDAIQFARYAPLLARRGARVIVSAPPELARLMESLHGIDQVTREREPKIDYDLHAPFLSLPRLLGTTLESIPSDVPYLHADPELVRHWKARLPGDAGLLKVGVAWAGRRTHADDRNRSIALSRLTPLLQAPAARFTSLQKGEPADSLRAIQSQWSVTDFTSELHDFAATAALIGALDLVIAVDTAVAHLAGALGKPVWILLPFVPDWRWLLHRLDSPWYPTMRLFRQPTPGDWASPIAGIIQQLHELTHEP